MGKSLCEHNEDNQCVENFSWILDPTLYKDNPLRFKPCERHTCRNVLNVHSSLNVPITVQFGHKPYEYQKYAKQLKQCGKAFSDNPSQILERIHASKKPDGCKQYRKEFRNNVTERQMVTHRGDGPCKCKKYFPNPAYLECHEKMHHEERPYVCKYCEKTFTRSGSLRCHERIHTGEKPYACKQCGKAFTTHTSLRCHEKIHTGEKPYECKQCGKSFMLYRYLCHERIHSEEKPYICKQCGKAFTTHNSLHHHERTHIGEKPYVCKQCGKAFRTQNSLYHHERTHTGEKPYGLSGTALGKGLLSSQEAIKCSNITFLILFCYLF
uniref:C2H2-type domain-containing protein n=1 Tax=Peromyscus maniculatus bairdii TaxID=230844 RepID=A0A8C8UJ57_PERMB